MYIFKQGELERKIIDSKWIFESIFQLGASLANGARININIYYYLFVRISINQ